MATSSVRKLVPNEVSVIVVALELLAKSQERAARAATNSVISGEHMKEAATCRNLIAHFKNASLDV